MTVQETQMPVNVAPAIGSRFGNFTARVGGRLRLGLCAKFRRYGLSRDLTLFFENPVAKIPIAIRPLQSRDLASLFASNSASDSAERLEIAWRRAFVDKGARGGFVAVDSRNDLPCYVQWLFGAQDNEFIRNLGGFPALQPGQALLENAYTPPAYRGLGIMSAAMALIAERAIDFGAREVQTFVDEHNIASLKGCQRAGFYPRLLHDRTRLCFGLITRDSFGRLPDDDPRQSKKF